MALYPSTPPDAASVENFVYRQFFSFVWRFLKSNNSVVAVSADYTVPTSVFFVKVDASGGARAISLPDATGIEGKQIIVKKIDSSGNAVTVTPYSTQTIDGSASKNTATQWGTIKVYSDGYNWMTF